MATRGARPKATHLRLLDGTHRSDRHGDVEQAKRSVEKTKQAFGPLQKPKWMRGEAAKFWNERISKCYWLDSSREAAAIVLCELWAEFRHAPTAFPASRHAIMRRYLNDLGLEDERERGVKEADTKSDKDEFFD